MVRGAILLAVAGLVAAGIGFAMTAGGSKFAEPQAVAIASKSTQPVEVSASVVSASVAPPEAFVAAPNAAPVLKTRGLSAEVAQTSSKCRIPDGTICYVPAQPIGAPCQCPGNSNGVIVW